MNEDTAGRLIDGSPTSESDRAIKHLRQSIMEGRHWYVPLLQAIAMWTAAEETHNGRTYRYLIGGEAFDWLLLAERLCEAVKGQVPEDEETALLFRGEPPVSLTPSEFEQYIGAAKYRQYLNYFYGITVEEALVLAIQEEVRKEKRASGYPREPDASNEAYRRIYGLNMQTMLRHFRREVGHPDTRSIDITQLKEFAYWRFKYRIKVCEKAKVASDTRKALNWLRERRVAGYLPRQDINEAREQTPDIE